MPPRKLIRKPKKMKKPKKTLRRQTLSRPGKRKSASRQGSNTAAAGKFKAKSIGKLFEDLVAVQAQLRAPGGCPWDREQTHDSLKTYLVEESYEVLDALEGGDTGELAEELGDLLFQVLFHADLAREAGTFDISDVVTGIHDKMIRRHPHVFGDVQAKTSGEVLKNWALLKAQEKQAASGAAASEKSLAPSALDGVPRHLPALLEAYQLTRRAARVGFDWETVEGIFSKMREEISELQVELNAAGQSDSREVQEEVGDILFVAVNLARFLGFDPEVALKKTNLKFKSRFHLMEAEASQSGQSLGELSKEQLEVLWEKAKEMSKSNSTRAGSEF